MIAKTFMGLEDVLAQELTNIGAKEISKGCRMVSFKGDKRLMYKANFALRTAIRILKPIKVFTANSADEVNEAVKEIDWKEYIDAKSSFSIDSVVYSDVFTNSQFVTYRVKDAIVDWFREKEGIRPSISISDPDIKLNIHISGTEATLSIDSSGDSLHLRGYRNDSVIAPMNEVLAAGLILMTGWKGEKDFIDPMCGSGTIPIEAALIARNIAPGVYRKKYAFEKWKDFDKEQFEEIYNDDSEEREFTHHIYGYDIDEKAIRISQDNIKSAGVGKDITIEQKDFQDFKGIDNEATIIINPPYGERITTQNLLATYKMIGERLKHAFKGNEAWVISSNKECLEQIGLKPSVKVSLYNGALECEYRKYTIFDGKLQQFREKGGIVKTEEEKQYMSERRKAWKQKEFEKKQTDKINNEDADILSFRFTSLEKNKEARNFKKNNKYNKYKVKEDKSKDNKSDKINK